jgi:hypothetical protein
MGRVHPLQAALRPFVTAPELLPAGAAEAAPEILPGLVLATAVLAGDRVDFLPPAQAGPFGGPEAARAAALENLAGLPRPTVEPVAAAGGRPDSVVWVARYDDAFGSGRAGALGTLLGDLVAAGLAAADIQRSHGLLLALPSWRVVLVHLIGGPGVLAALKLMGTAADGEYEAAARERVSPNVFFVAGGDGPRQVVAFPDPQRGIVVETRGAIGEVLYGSRGLLGPGS